MHIHASTHQERIHERICLLFLFKIKKDLTHEDRGFIQILKLKIENHLLEILTMKTFQRFHKLASDIPSSKEYCQQFLYIV